MADKVHPGGDASPPPSYIIQVPKDQIYRVPPPENAHRYKLYTSRAGRRGRGGCCRCLAWSLGIIVLLAFLLAVAAGVLYFVFRPKLPTYSVQTLEIIGLNVSSTAKSFSPEFHLGVKAENSNKKIGIYYRKGSSIRVSYSGVEICAGELPAFYQGKRNTTLVQTVLRGTGIELSDGMRRDLTAEERRGKVPLRIAVEIPVRVKFGALTTWTVTLKSRCDVEVDRLATDAKIVENSQACKLKHVKLF